MVLPLGLMVPLVGESVSQVAVLAAVQLQGAAARILDGESRVRREKWPAHRTGRVEVPAPLTTMTGAPLTVRVTESAASPLPEVAFTKLSVSV